MSITELERALRALRLSGMIATLQARALQVAHHADGLHRGVLLARPGRARPAPLAPARSALRALGAARAQGPEGLRLGLQPELPKREVLELATLKFIEAREGALLIGPPGTGKSHIAKALAQLGRPARLQGPLSRGAQLIEEINEARELGEIRKYRAQMKAAELLVIDDLFLRKLPANAGDELAEVLMSRYEKALDRHHLEPAHRRLGEAPRRCRRRHAATRSPHASRAPAEVRRQELAPEGSRCTCCQARSTD